MFRRFLVALVVLLASVPAAYAQQHVVFVHGLNSGSNTWDPVAQRLEGRLNMEEDRTTTSSWLDYEIQGLQLDGVFGGLPASTVAVGHSNGGVVSRQWSKLKNIEGIVTLGTPNQGAPLAQNIFNWLNLMQDALDNKDTVANMFASPEHNAHWNDPANGTWANVSASLSNFLDLHTLMGNAIDITIAILSQTVLDEMRPDSPFFADLNSGSNLFRESIVVDHRASILVSEPNYFAGGPIRLAVPPQDADAYAAAMIVVAAGLEGLGGILIATADQNDPQALADAQNRAAVLYAISGFLTNVPDMWCRAVSAANFSQCSENDSLVPVWSQKWPGSLFIPWTDSTAVAHTFETKSGEDVLFTALTQYMNIAPRGPVGPPPAPTYVGCFVDQENRALPAWFGEGFTVDSCVQTALANGYSYAGVQWYGHCFAGNAIGYQQVDDSECNTPCNNNPAQMCGGGWRNSIYTTGLTPPPPPPPPPPPVGPVIGFYADNGQYVSAENNGGGNITANRDWLGSWESFELIDFNGGNLHDGDQVALRTGSGLYFQAVNGGGGQLLAVGGGPWSWETFTFVDLDRPGQDAGNHDAFALISEQGYSISAVNGGGDIVTVDKPWIGSWETFRIVFQ